MQYSNWLVSAGICWYLLVSPDVCRCLLVSACICQCLSVSPISAGVCWYLPYLLVFAGVCWYRPVSPDIRWYPLSICCLSAVYLLSICCLSAVYLLSICCLSAVYLLSICCLSAVYLLSICCLSAVDLLSICRLSAVYLLSMLSILFASVYSSRLPTVRVCLQFASAYSSRPSTVRVCLQLLPMYEVQQQVRDAGVAAAPPADDVAHLPVSPLLKGVHLRALPTQTPADARHHRWAHTCRQTRSSAFQLGIFPRALRLALTVLHPAQFTVPRFVPMLSSIDHKIVPRSCFVCALNCARILVVRALDCAQFLSHPALFPN